MRGYLDSRPGRDAWLYGALRASPFVRSGRISAKRLSCPRKRARYGTAYLTDSPAGKLIVVAPVVLAR